jgi:predicted aminopeptidase
VPAFQRLLAESGSLETFYKRVKELAKSERSERATRLSSR